jgi:hypothetical protein
LWWNLGRARVHGVRGGVPGRHLAWDMDGFCAQNETDYPETARNVKHSLGREIESLLLLLLLMTILTQLFTHLLILFLKIAKL